METLLTRKLLVARQSLSLSQSDLGRAKVYHQGSQSQLEQGNRANVPLKYLRWLSDKGINMTALFSDKVSEEDFALMCRNRTNPTYQPEHCPNCETKDTMLEEKDRRITSLIETIDAKNDIIALLKGSQGSVSRAG